MWGSTIEQFLFIMFQYDKREPVDQHKQQQDFVVWKPEYKNEEPPF